MFVRHSELNRVLFDGVRVYVTLQESKIRCEASFWGSSADQVVYLRKFALLVCALLQRSFTLLSFVLRSFTVLRRAPLSNSSCFRDILFFSLIFAVTVLWQRPKWSFHVYLSRMYVCGFNYKCFLAHIIIYVFFTILLVLPLIEHFYA